MGLGGSGSGLPAQPPTAAAVYGRTTRVLTCVLMIPTVLRPIAREGSSNHTLCEFL